MFYKSFKRLVFCLYKLLKYLLVGKYFENVKGVIVFDVFAIKVQRP